MTVGMSTGNLAHLGMLTPLNSRSMPHLRSKVKTVSRFNGRYPYPDTLVVIIFAQEVVGNYVLELYLKMLCLCLLGQNCLHLTF